MREHPNPNDLKIIAADDVISSMTVNLKNKKKAQTVLILDALYSYQLQAQLQGHREGKQMKESTKTDPSKNKNKKVKFLALW